MLVTPRFFFHSQMYHSQPLPGSHIPTFFPPSPLLPMMTQSCDTAPHHTAQSYRPIGEVVMPPNIENRSSRSIERILDAHGNERARDDYSSGEGRGATLPFFPYPSVGADVFALNCAAQLFGELNLTYVFGMQWVTVLL